MTSTLSTGDGESQLGLLLVRAGGARVGSISDLKAGDLHFVRFIKYLTPPSEEDIAIRPCSLHKEVFKRSALQRTLTFILGYTVSKAVIMKAPVLFFNTNFSISFRYTT